MNFLNIFKNKKKITLPESYRGIISSDDYDYVLELTQKYHVENDIKIVEIKDGELILEADEEGFEQRRYLDNLVKLLSQNKKEIWGQLIHEHFDKIKDHSAAYNYIFKDFDYASQFLRVLIKPDNIDLGGGSLADIAHRIDFPHTITFLVLEFENQFRYLSYDDIKEWNRPQEELFSIAISNIPDEEIDIKEYEFLDKFTVYAFFSGDYSSSLMLDLSNRADYGIGTFGSLIMIPSKGVAYVHPIETVDILDLVEKLYPLIETSFDEDPGEITTNFYWLYNDEIQVFPTKSDRKGLTIALPQNLAILFKN